MSACERRVSVPDSWKEMTLEDVAVVAPSGKFDPKRGPVLPYVGMENLQPGRRLVAGYGRSNETSSAKTEFRPGDVLYGKLRPYLRKIALADRAGVCSTEILALRPRDGMVIPEFLYYACCSSTLLAYAVNHSAGTRMPRISAKQLLQACIQVPPREEQERIVDILTVIDQAIAACSVESETLRRLQAARVDDVMGTSEAREQLGDVADVRSGLAKGRKPAGATVSVPFLRTANVQDGWLDLSEMHELGVSASDAERYALESGDVLLVEGSGSPERLGTGWIWEGQVDGCIHQNHVFAIRAGARLDPRWLAYWVTSSESRRYFRACVKTSSGLGTINKRQVSALLLPVPPTGRQAQVVDELESIRKTRAHVTERMSALDRARQALLAALLSGRRQLPASYDRFVTDEDRADATPEPATV